MLLSIILQKAYKSAKVKEVSLGNTIYVEQFYFVWTTFAFYTTYILLFLFYKNTPFILRKSLHYNDLELLTPRRETLSLYLTTTYSYSLFFLFYSLMFLTLNDDNV